MKVNKFLIIQTAFIGDVVLATTVVEKLKKKHPHASIDFLLRKGNENILEQNPNIHQIIIWDKKDKIQSMWEVIKTIRKEKYDVLVNLHRFASSGIVTLLSNAKIKVGFDKNPFSFCYDIKKKHQITPSKHEVHRNLELVEKWTDKEFEYPKVYPSEKHEKKVEKYQNEAYITIAPSSIWFTKQLPTKKWVELIHLLGKNIKIYLIGSPSDFQTCEDIVLKSNKNVVNLAGKLSLLESAALMKKAQVNYMNDSAPMHLASAVNAPTVAFFCSTIPQFGFGPLAFASKIIESPKDLPCRPCGIHGYKSCPKKHFLCAESINISDALALP